MVDVWNKGDVSKNGRPECESGPGGCLLLGARHHERGAALASGAWTLPLWLGIRSVAGSALDHTARGSHHALRYYI